MPMRKSGARCALLIGTVTMSMRRYARRQMMDTTWYDGDWQPCTADSAGYYRIERVADSGSIEEDRYRNGCC